MGFEVLNQIIIKAMRKQKMVNAIFGCIIILLAILSGWFYIKTMNLEGQNTELRSQVDALEKPQLHLINFAWSDNPYGGDYREVIANGTVFNSGTLKAHMVDVKITVYDSQNNTLGEELFLISSILLGKSYVNFNGLHVVYHVSEFGFAHHVEAEPYFSGYS